MLLPSKVLILATDVTFGRLFLLTRVGLESMTKGFSVPCSSRSTVCALDTSCPFGTASTRCYNVLLREAYGLWNEGRQMREAKLDGRTVHAGPDSPEVAECPVCGGEVRKRKRKVGKNKYTHFYRHRAGSSEDCPLRYRPTG